MAEPGLGAGLGIWLNNVKLATIKSASKTVNGEKVAIKSFDGIIGYIRGAGFTSIELSLALLTAGAEADFDTYAQTDEYVTVQFDTGPKSYISRMQVMTATTTRSDIGSPVEMSVTLEGPNKKQK